MTPTFFQKLFAKGWVWTCGFFAIAVGFALAIAILASPDRHQMMVLALCGSAGGAVVSWILLKIGWQIRVRINGGPFHKGDLVQIISGAHAGKTATVYEEWPSRKQVRLSLGEAALTHVKDVFSYIQLRRIGNSDSKGE